jgi:hypothetical protein
MPKYYIIESTPYKFGAIVRKLPHEQRTIVSIGGKKECLNFSIYWDDNRHHLEGMNYDENCVMNESEKLVPNAGTVKMLKASLKFILYLYPNTKSVTLKDSSFLKCKKSIKVSLSDLYIAKYGKTWYQYKFNAIPENETEYFQYLMSINTILEKPITQSFEEFYKAYIKLHRIQIKNLNDNLQQIYTQSHTMREFITNVHKFTTDCRIFESWLSYYMSKIGVASLNLHHIFFDIHKSTIDSWNIPTTFTETDQLPNNKFYKEPIFNINGGHCDFNDYLVKKN